MRSHIQNPADKKQHHVIGENGKRQPRVNGAETERRLGSEVEQEAEGKCWQEAADTTAATSADGSWAAGPISRAKATTTSHKLASSNRGGSAAWKRSRLTGTVSQSRRATVNP